MEVQRYLNPDCKIIENHSFMKEILQNRNHYCE